MNFYKLRDAVGAALHPQKTPKTPGDEPGRVGFPRVAGSHRAGVGKVDQLSKPPASNTGGKLTTTGTGITVGLHWISASGPSAVLEEIRTVAGEYFGESDLLERGGNTYQRQHRWECGAALFFSDGRPDCLLTCSGDVVDGMTPADQLRLLRQLHGYGFRTTRLDARADDWERVAPLDLVHAAAESGDFVHFRRTEPHQPKRLTAEGMELIGDSRTFGRRGTDGSGVYYRVYDKLLESKGEIDCIRWEAEFSGDKAHEVGRLLCECEDDEQFARLLGSLVGGNIDFRERGSETHVDRRPRLVWWAALLEKLGQTRIRIDRAAAPLQAALRAVARQYASTLAKAKIICDRQGVNLLGHLQALIADACSVLDARKLEACDVAINLSEAFNLKPRPRVSFAPPLSFGSSPF